jgi:predicted amidohydrolase
VGIPESIGTLRPGAEGDVAIFRLEEGEFEFVDCEGQVVLGERRLIPMDVIRDGQLYDKGPRIQR